MSHHNGSWSRYGKTRESSNVFSLSLVTRMFVISKIAIGVIPLLLVGCSTATVDLSHYSLRQVSPLSQTKLFTIAEEQLRELGYTVYQRDATMGSLHAKASVNAGRSSQHSSRINQRSGGTRRHAVVRIDSDTQRSAVYCKVLLQQRVTEAHRMLQRDSSGQDTPNETPIERDAATTVEQNTLWRTLRRDRRSEHELLNAIDKASKNDK